MSKPITPSFPKMRKKIVDEIKVDYPFASEVEIRLVYELRTTKVPTMLDTVAPRESREET